MKIEFRFVVSICVIAVCLMNPGILRAQTSVEPSPISNYVIGTGDTLTITITGQDALSRDGLRVNNDGTIRIPMIKEPISAACKTTYQLSDRITAAYREFLLRPEVSVEIKEFRSQPVSLIGAVVQAKSFELRQPTRFLKLLSLVNGPSEKAGKFARVIRAPGSYRCVEGQFETLTEDFRQEVVSVDLEATLSGDVTANPVIHAGDIITIPEKDEIPVAYVYGNVGRAVAVELKDQTTLSRALAIAGGTSRGADLSKIRIYRQDPKTLKKNTIVVNLKNVNKDKARDVILEPNDMVEVPGPSGARKFFGDIFRVLAPTIGRGVVPIP